MSFDNGATALELWESPITETEYIIEGVIPKGLNLLAGPEKAGKSTLATQIAISTGAGEHFLDNFKTTESDVLFLSLEEATELTKKRIKVLRKDNKPTSNIDYRFGIESLDEGGLDRLEYYLEQFKNVGLVNIDTYAHFIGDGLNSKQGYLNETRIARRIHKMAKYYDVAFVVLHHMVKNIEGSLNDLRGSGGLTGVADNILMLTKDEPSGIGKLRRIGRYGDADYALKYDKKSLSWNYLGEFDDTILTPERLDVLEVLFDKYGPVEVKEIRKEIRKSPSATSNLLKKLLKQGMVWKTSFRTYEITDDGRKAVVSQSQLI